MRNTSENIVILAGSGRSGTTWLGSLLDSYEHAEYFYEICHIDGLDYDSPHLLKTKYPYSHWLKNRPLWLRRAERHWLARRAIKNSDQNLLNSLRVHHRVMFEKKHIDVHVFKIVKILILALELNALKEKFGDRLKVIHLVRNPYPQLASEKRQHSKNLDRIKQYFGERTQFVLDNPQLVKFHELARQALEDDWFAQTVFLWRVSNELMLDQGDYVCRVVYEDLCRDPRGETQRVFDFLGWQMGAQTESQIAETTAVTSAESGEWSIRKKASESMNKWRSEIDPDDYQRVRRFVETSPLMSLWTPEELSLDVTTSE